MIQKADDQIEAGLNEKNQLLRELDFLQQKIREDDHYIMNIILENITLGRQLQKCKDQRDAWINSYTSIPEQIISRENKELEEIVK